jgi:hypothetical protein
MSDVKKVNSDEFLIWELAHLKKASSVIVPEIASGEQKTVQLDGDNYTMNVVQVRITPTQMQELFELANYLSLQRASLGLNKDA